MDKTLKLSQQLQNLFHDHKKIHINKLNELVGEKSFALAFILLLMTAALPLPTGGITHFFEIIAALLALELVLGQKNIWLPKRWRKASIRSPKPGKGLSRLIGIIRWLEKYSKPRGVDISANASLLRLVGVMVVIFTVTAFLAPPFSGLDTLPALGVVVLSLGIMLDDWVICLIGIGVGIAGILAVVLLSQAVLTWGTQLFQ